MTAMGFDFGQTAAGSPSTSRADNLFDYLVSQGASPAGAAGVVGNLQGESGLTLDSGVVGDGGTSGGIAQWHNDRWSSLKSFAASIGLPWTDFGAQSQYLVQDLKAYNLWDTVKTAQEPDSVVAALVTRYEKPADPAGAISRRTPLARAVLKRDQPGAWDRAKSLLSDPTAAASGVLSGVGPIITKALAVGLGVALIGVGLVKATGAGKVAQDIGKAVI